MILSFRHRILGLFLLAAWTTFAGSGVLMGTKEGDLFTPSARLGAAGTPMSFDRAL
jgi:hypothetical protein